MHHTPSTHASDGVARAVQDYDSLVETAMQRTGSKVRKWNMLILCSIIY